MSKGRSIFFCYPDFDSPTIFAALLDRERGGSFALNPECEDMRVKQLYLPNTNILLTRLLSEQGVAEVTDFMPVGNGNGQAQATVRQPHHPHAARDQGAGALRDVLRAAIRLRPIGPPGGGGSGRGRLHAGLPDCPRVALHATFPLRIVGTDAHASFTLNAGETAMMAFGETADNEKTLGVPLDPDRYPRSSSTRRRVSGAIG